MGLEICKHYFSYSFHLISTKLYEDLDCHNGIQAVTFIGSRPSLKVCATLNWESMGKS